MSPLETMEFFHIIVRQYGIASTFAVFWHVFDQSIYKKYVLIIDDNIDL